MDEPARAEEDGTDGITDVELVGAELSEVGETIFSGWTIPVFCPHGQPVSQSALITKDGRIVVPKDNCIKTRHRILRHAPS